MLHKRLMMIAVLTGCATVANEPTRTHVVTEHHEQQLPQKSDVEGRGWSTKLPNDCILIASTDTGFVVDMDGTRVSVSVAIGERVGDIGDVAYDMFRNDPTIEPVVSGRRLLVNELDGFVVAGRRSITSLFNFVANHNDSSVTLRCSGDDTIVNVGGRCYRLLQGLSLFR